MAKKKKGERGENSSFNLFIPAHNALGIKNWPHYVQEEKERLTERRFSFNEECVFAGLDGRPIFNIFDSISQDILDPADVVMNYDHGKKIDEYMHSMYLWREHINPQFSPEIIAILPNYSLGLETSFQPSFHGTTRQNITPKTHRRAEPNTKRRYCRYIDRTTIRTMHFEKLSAEDE